MGLRKSEVIKIAAPVALGLLAYLMTVPFVYVITGLAITWAVFIILGYMKNNRYKDDMEVAWDYLRRWWLHKTEGAEDLGITYSEGIARYFGKSESDIIIAFKVMRKNKRPFIAVVKLHPQIKILNWADDLQDTYDERWINPFKSVATHFTGTPSPSMSAEFEVSLSQRRKTKKEKKEEKKEDKEDQYGSFEPAEE